MKTKNTLIITALTLSLLTGTASNAYATETTGNVNARIAKLEEEIALLKRQLEVQDEKQKAVSEKAATVEVGKKGLAITSPDKKYGVSLRGYYQVDNRQFLNDDAGTGKDDITSRRIRPILEGKAGDASFRFMPDFAGSSTRVFDAHIDYKFADAASVRVGKFKPPVGLERLQSATDISFIERGHPTNLAPNRDYGVMLYGEFIPDTLEYQLGVFDGTSDLGNNDSDDDDKKDLVARVFAHPFRNADTIALRGFGVGIAGTLGDREGAASKPILGSYKTPGQQDFFKYRSATAAADTTFASGEQWRLYPQGYWYYGPVGVLAEYAISNQEVTRGSSSAKLKNTAWQVAASYVLTGEDANYRGGVKPLHDFDVSKGDLGAFELVGRYGETDVDDAAFPLFADSSKSASLAQSYGAGLNWYLSENVKLAFDYDFTRFDGGAAAGGDRPDEHALFQRVQFKF